MPLKITFLGAGSAFTVGDDNFQSNVLLESNGDSLLIDAGADLRLSLFALNRSYHDIHNIYITHLHSDHIGGLEWLALATYFDDTYPGKPTLYAEEKLMQALWHSLAGGLSTLAYQQASLNTYFNVQAIGKEHAFTWQKIQFKLIQAIHVYSNYHLLPCYGLLFSYGTSRIFYSADTQYNPYLIQQLNKEVDLFFHDCETQEIKSGVHAHYSELRQLPTEIKRKMWLYHYNNVQALPDAKADGFLGFVTRGQSFNFK
ncbi:metal-dependent hydrolase of the beta-lactamase superfamily transporter III [Legionella busanensis]|uniref:Metal-dependent hydrolase of the beta-lactamase superfamily transporter III n=1 Tax=Legionella busanensis TaxID=190655 RepID=A0A378JGF9_9GAMM|nr:MBL fold metallo-hydrolase [Legionella busanensis]STX50077.1 metal-dependent hydrolase of the beta-lactamase superfamily transporter III [Legionella busanensis]